MGTSRRDYGNQIFDCVAGIAVYVAAVSLGRRLHLHRVARSALRPDWVSWRFAGAGLLTLNSRLPRLAASPSYIVHVHIATVCHTCTLIRQVSRCRGGYGCGVDLYCDCANYRYVGSLLPTVTAPCLDTATVSTAVETPFDSRAGLAKCHNSQTSAVKSDPVTNSSHLPSEKGKRAHATPPQLGTRAFSRGSHGRDALLPRSRREHSYS